MKEEEDGTIKYRLKANPPWTRGELDQRIATAGDGFDLGSFVKHPCLSSKSESLFCMHCA